MKLVVMLLLPCFLSAKSHICLSVWVCVQQRTGMKLAGPGMSVAPTFFSSHLFKEKKQDEKSNSETYV